MNRSAELQLIDWSQDKLIARGVTPVKGQIRPGFVQGTQLLAASDQQLESFDIENRDRPSWTGAQPLAQAVNRTLVMDEGKIVRLSQDAATGVTELDVTSPDLAATPSAARLEIGGLGDACAGDARLIAALASDDRAYLVYGV